MEIKLTIDGDQFSENITEMFEKLDDEQVKEVLSNVIKNFLGVDPEYNLVQAEMQLIAERNRNSWHYRDGLSHDQKQQLDKFISTRQKMVNTISDKIASHMSEQVDKLITEDSFLKSAWMRLREELVKTFPEMVQAAITGWFIKNMSEVRNQLEADWQDSGTIAGRLKGLTEKLACRLLPDGQPVLEEEGY